MSAFCFDFAVRQKVPGTHLTYGIVKQLPVLLPSIYNEYCPWQTPNITHHAWLLPRVLELTYTAYDLRAFAQDCGYHGPPFRWDEERRFLLRCEVDAAYFHLYDIARDDVDYIMETFPIVRRKDEAAFGDYRTKRLILAIYDAMATAIQTGHPYQTLLDPPPAHPGAAHAWDESQLGPYCAPSLWWEKDDKTGGQDDKVTAAGREGSGDRAASGSATHLSATKPAAVEPKAAQALQPALLAVMPPPSGPRARRLQQVMALGKDGSATATRGLVAFLADEDTNIRWLAGSSLVQRASHDVVAAMMSFLTGVEAAQISAARPEIQRVLGLIAETVEDETVRAAARQVLDEL